LCNLLVKEKESSSTHAAFHS